MRRTARPFLLTALLLLRLLPGAVGAETVPIDSIVPREGGGKSASPSSPPEMREHRLGPGDQVEIHIVALPELERLFTVRNDGGFYHPLVGEIQAQGLTVDDLQAEMKRRLARELRNPAVKVGIRSLGRQDVTVLGAVRTPGKYRVSPGATLLDVLAMAGGATPDADLEGALLIRGSETMRVKLLPPEPGSDTPPRPVQPGDILYVVKGITVIVTGEVFDPGPHAVTRQGAAPRQALRAAGGAKPGAALHRVVLERANERHLLDLSPGGGELPEELATLQEGDVLHVPAHECVVLGGGKGGKVPLHGKDNILEVLSEGGGFDPRKIERITLIRAADVREGRQRTEEVDLSPYFEEGDTSVLVPVYDGDVVYVETRDGPGGGFNFLSLLFWARTLLGF